MKILMVILDGAGDTGEKTPYETARKPAMDSLARTGTCGLLDVGYKSEVESDIGDLSLLGFFAKDTYPGRGYLEALAIGMRDIDKSDICVRGNLATIDKNGNIWERRAGREEFGLEELAESIDGLEIDGVQFIVRKSSGHRIVVIMRPMSEKVRLSENVETNDPKLEGVPVPQIRPKTADAKFTASVLNKFVFRTSKMLAANPVNKKRKFPVNMLLLRGFGHKKIMPDSFKKKYDMSSCVIGGIPIIKGVASFLGMDIVNVHGATGYPDTNLQGKFDMAAESLLKYEFVVLHVNGTDILSHDAKRVEKTKFIEKIDENLGAMLKKIDLKKTVVIITSDHRTSSDPAYKQYRHTTDPVPVLISGGGINVAISRKFDERGCARGFLLKGNDLLPYVFRLLEQAK
jgi:2,3-bisphosphoglycerate-independent phosphoglycerate mutase